MSGPNQSRPSRGAGAKGCTSQRQPPAQEQGEVELGLEAGHEANHDDSPSVGDGLEVFVEIGSSNQV